MFGFTIYWNVSGTHTRESLGVLTFGCEAFVRCPSKTMKKALESKVWMKGRHLQITGKYLIVKALGLDHQNVNVGRKMKGWALESSKLRDRAKWRNQGKRTKKNSQREDHYLFHLVYFNRIFPFLILSLSIYSPQIGSKILCKSTFLALNPSVVSFLYLQELVLHCQSIQKH